MAWDYLEEGGGAGIPHIFVFGNGYGAHVAAYLALYFTISGAVFSHTNEDFQNNIKKYVVYYLMFLQSVTIL